jgi:hypothetical protein
VGLEAANVPLESVFAELRRRSGSLVAPMGLHWAVNGFETTLLTVVFLWALTRALDDADRGECSIGRCRAWR